ncbi:hypothetical protein RB593_004343 [Gaeumannomyces tritici]
MNVLKLQRKFPQFQQNEIFELSNSFAKLDVDDKGYLDEATAIKATQQSERQPYDVVRQALKEVELDSSRRVELEDYVGLIAKLRDSSPAQKRMSTGPGPLAPSGVVAQRTGGHASKSSISGKIQVQGSNANITHTINEDERTEFTRHINAVLAGDADIGSRLPFPTDTFEMFDECKDGLVLAKLINDSVPDTIDERVLNRPGKKTKNLNAFQMTENNNIVIESAKGIGCSVVNIGSGDIIELGKQNGFSLVGIQGADITDGQKTLTLGLVWQLMRRDITMTLSALAQRLGKREITDAEMVRWANDMSRKGGQSSSIRSFKDSAIGTGVFLLDVLNGMKSSYVDYELVTPGRTDEDAYLNAKLSISIARKMGATIWLVPEDICQVRSRLVTTFIGSLMATYEKMQ